MHRRILVADHDLTSQAMKKLAADDTDLQIDCIEDAAAALRALNEQNYSIFLMDVLMPGLGGIQLMEEIQKRNIPVTVIVMTGHNSIDQAVQAMRLGAYDILTKPVDVHHLRSEDTRLNSSHLGISYAVFCLK